MKDIIIITGPSGAGKDYFSEKKFKNYDSLDRIDHHNLTPDRLLKFLRTLRSLNLIINEHYIPMIYDLQNKADLVIKSIIFVRPSFKFWRRVTQLKLDETLASKEDWKGKESNIRWWSKCLDYTEKQFTSYMDTILKNISQYNIPVEVVYNDPKDIDAIKIGWHKKGEVK